MRHIPRIFFGLIFATAFTGTGLYIGYQSLSGTLSLWWNAKDWQAVSAQITGLKAADNDTLASYSYEVNGIPYENNRVYVADFKDNIGSYHRDLHAQLARAQSGGTPITIWYNPANPRQSVLDRNMRWGMFSLILVFCAFFVLIGLAVSYAIIFAKSSRPNKALSLISLRRQWQEKHKDPDYGESFLSFVHEQRHRHSQQQTADKPSQAGPSPWLARKEWRSARIRAGAGVKIAVLWFVTALWNGISSPIIFQFNKEWASGNYLILIGLLFPLVGVFLLVHTLRSSAQWLRFRKLVLVLDPFPGAIGGHVGGYLDLNGQHDKHARYNVALECVYSYVSGSGDNRTRRENVKWSESGTARARNTSRGLRLSFRFEVPENLPEADVDQSDAYTFWRLKLNADIPGADLNSEFNIPVFKTAEQSSYVSHDVSAQHKQLQQDAARTIQDAVEQGRFEQTELHNVMRHQHTAGGSSFEFPMLRNKTAAIFAAIFCGGFGTATYAMWHNFGNHGGFGIFVLVFSIPFFLVALLSGIIMVYLLFNSLKVQFSHQGIHTVRSLMLLPLFKRVCSRDDINSLDIKRTASSGQGSKMVEYYKVFAKTKDYKNITLAEGVKGKDLATQLKAFMEQQLR